jgi:hypothetical protein
MQFLPLVKNKTSSDQYIISYVINIPWRCKPHHRINTVKRNRNNVGTYALIVLGKNIEYFVRMLHNPIINFIEQYTGRTSSSMVQ